MRVGLARRVVAAAQSRTTAGPRSDSHRHPARHRGRAGIHRRRAAPTGTHPREPALRGGPHVLRVRSRLRRQRDQGLPRDLRRNSVRLRREGRRPRATRRDQHRRDRHGRRRPDPRDLERSRWRRALCALRHPLRSVGRCGGGRQHPLDRLQAGRRGGGAGPRCRRNSARGVERARRRRPPPSSLRQPRGRRLARSTRRGRRHRLRSTVERLQCLASGDRLHRGRDACGELARRHRRLHPRRRRAGAPARQGRQLDPVGAHRGSGGERARQRPLSPGDARWPRPPHLLRQPHQPDPLLVRRGGWFPRRPPAAGTGHPRSVARAGPVGRRLHLRPRRSRRRHLRTRERSVLLPPLARILLGSVDPLPEGKLRLVGEHSLVAVLPLSSRGNRRGVLGRLVSERRPPRSQLSPRE